MEICYTSARSIRGRLPIHADADSSLVDERFGESLYLRVTVKKQDASIYVIVSDMKKSQPPYRIENECTCASIRILQKGVAASSQITIAPMKNTTYTWTEPLKPKKLLIQAVPIHGPSKRRNAHAIAVAGKYALNGVTKLSKQTMHYARTSIKMVQQSALKVIKKGGSSNKNIERNVFNVPQEQIDIVEIIKLHVDNGLGLPLLFL